MAIKIIPIILAGGVGTRLWPLSRESYPKQFLRLFSQYSLLQETVLRVNSLPNVEQPFIVCNSDHYFISHDHLKEIKVSGYRFILEPFGKNTAPAIACAAKTAVDCGNNESILLVLPSDHYIADLNLFFDAISQAQEIAAQGFLVSFGVVPTNPETGYGYIQAGEQLNPDAYRVEKFIEKPNLELAKKFLDTGGFYWNSGMFMFKPEVYLEELKKHSPDIHYFALQSMLKSENKNDFIRLDAEIFAECPNNSIDYAVMEKTQKAIVISLASSWNDLGCWSAVAKSGSCDTEKNVIKGEVLVKDCEHCFVSAQGQMVAVLGLKNQIVVTTPDVVLVANKAYSQEVKYLVQQLKSYNSDLVTHHRKHSNPSGYIENLVMEDYFGIEHFMLKPQTNLELPLGSYPAYWIVVSGKAEILTNNHSYALNEGKSLFIEQRSLCHLVNHAELPLHLLRIQLKSTMEMSVL